MSAGLGKTACVIGAGALGLVALKNFLEEGFEVTVYERNDYVGGLWHATKDTTQTSVLESTKANVSKHGACFSDFPFPDHVGLHPTAKQTQEYLESYAEHFELNCYIKLASTVLKIERDNTQQKWLVTTTFKGSTTTKPETCVFDRLILATGPHSRIKMPKLECSDRFEGDLVHSQQFKEPAKYAGKAVVVLGTGATAADIMEFLRVAGANKIYMSHRRSFRLMSRTHEGKAIDANLTRRFSIIGSWIQTISPTLFELMMKFFVGKFQQTKWPQLTAHPAFGPSRILPPVNSTVPCVSDELAKNLVEGAVESVQAIDYISGPRSVTLKDGKVLDDVDAIICCTGTTFDFPSFLPRECDPTNPELAPDNFSALRASKFYREDTVMCRAYRNFLSLQHPHSLAFLGHSLYRRGSFPLYDLISMALAQLWKGTYPMPSSSEMEKECDGHYRYLLGEFKKGEIAITGLTGGIEYDQWLQEVAGTGLFEKLGWSWEGWQFWWNDRKLYSLLMDGIDSPHALRLFETIRGRRSWSGAGAAIEKANKEIETGVREWKQKKTS